MYVPEGGSMRGGEDEVIQQVVIILTSTASLVVLVTATFACGMCYCFGGSKPDYDDDEVTTGFRSSDQEQKWPILNRTASLGAGPKNGARSQSPVFVNQSSLSNKVDATIAKESDLSSDEKRNKLQSLIEQLLDETEKLSDLKYENGHWVAVEGNVSQAKIRRLQAEINAFDPEPEKYLEECRLYVSRPPSESDEEESIATYGTMENSSIATKTTVEATVEVQVEQADNVAQTSLDKPSHVDEKSTTLPSDLGSKRPETPKKSVMFRSISVDPASIPMHNFPQDCGSVYSEPVQPATKPGILHNVQSEPTMSLTNEFDRPKPKVGVEHVQPDPGKLAQNKLGGSNGQTEAIGIAQGLDDDSLHFGEDLGKIQFSIMYDFPDQTLVLRIVKANNLPAKDFSGTSDPFVKIMLLPDKKVKMETKVKRKNLNPIWNESFHFEGYPYSKIQERVLHLQVLDYDRFSRNDPIGEVNLPLAEVDLTHEKVYWRSLTPSKKSSGKLGSLLVSLCYAPTAGRITITILKCQNLAAKDITGKSDPYVKIWHMHKEKRIEKKKTVVKYHTLNPIYNESFVFNIPLDRIRDTTFVISVLDKDRLSKNDMIGGILLGARTSPAEMSHWNEMMSKPRTNIAKWHVLKGVN